jgi:hypothetical protein
MELADGAAPVKVGGMDSLFRSTGLKGSGGLDRFSWLGRMHYGPSRLHNAVCYFPSELFKSIQFNFKSGLNFGNS